MQSPFPGLRPFEEGDAELFFGQEEQQEALLGRLSTAHFVSVIGASGCGKSSLVRAGILPILRKQRERGAPRWHIALTHPGANPVRQMADSLNVLVPDRSAEWIETVLRRHTLGILDVLKNSEESAGKRLLIFIDQFEELFRYRRGLAADFALNESALYVKLLLEAAREPHSPVYIVTTMRSEYLEDCSEFYDLSEAMNRGLFLLPRMTRVQCEEAIVSPIEGMGYSIEPALIQELLNETEERSDGLPLLQHALRVIWDRWSLGDRKAVIGMRNFEINEGNPETPMVNRLLDAHLEQIYAELGDNQALVETCFKLLSEWDAKGRETRRPCPVREITEVGSVTLDRLQHVVSAFRDESKGRMFLRLMDEDRQSAANRRSIRSVDVLDMSHECLMRQWTRLRRWMTEEYENASTLRELAREAHVNSTLSDFAVRRFSRWRDKFHPSSSWALRYANAVHPVTGREEISLDAALAFLAQNQLRQQLVTKRRRLVSAVGVIVVALLGGVIVWGRIASADAIAASETKGRKAADVLRTSETKAKETAEKEKAAADLERVKATKLAEKARMSAASELKAKGEAIAAKNQAVIARDAAEKARGEADTKASQEALANAAAARALEEATRLTSKLKAQNVEIQKSDNSLKKLNALTLVQSARRRADTGKTDEALAYLARALQIDPDSTQASTWIVDLLLRKKLAEPALPFFHKPVQPQLNEPLLNASLSPDNDQFVLAWRNNTARIFRADGSLVANLLHKDAVNYSEFSRNGQSVVTASSDFTAIVWDVNGQPEGPPFEHKAAVLSASFSNSGEQIVTASWDRTAVVWNRKTRAKVVLQHPALVNFAAFNPDGSLVVTACYDGNARIWDVQKRQEIMMLPTGSNVRCARFSPDGKKVVTASVGGSALVWDSGDGQRIGEALDHKGPLNSVAFNPEGSWIVTASTDKTARVWETETGMPLGEPLVHRDRVSSAVFGHDGKTVLTSSRDGKAQIWDVRFDFSGSKIVLAKLAGALSGYKYDLLPSENLLASDNRQEQLRKLREEAAAANPAIGSAEWFVKWFLDQYRK